MVIKSIFLLLLSQLQDYCRLFEETIIVDLKKVAMKFEYHVKTVFSVLTNNNLCTYDFFILHSLFEDMFNCL